MIGDEAGTNTNAGLTAVQPIFQEIMTGRLPAAEGIPQAQEDGNAAMAG